ncbi:MAG: right-handed parallel beta-helix repeat-containing protein [Candidatus Omnitrophica bacterium]|nr:right-handed parallel beta-helix repeat-containing protein [Candidatus Omnitrophota bacterium]
MKKLILTLILGLTFTIPVFANGDNDNTDRLTSNQNYTFSPGYINAAKQQTDAILRQESPKKSLFDRAVEYVQSKLARKVEENANSKVTPNLQMRTSASQDSSQVASIATTLIDSSQYNVAIGTGTNQERDAFGRLMAEVINGTRHVYAGFDNYGTGTIQEAINKTNAGDMILVRGGANKTYDIANLYLKNGVSMYGGYDEYGVRDIENNVSSLQIAYNASSGIVLSNVDRPTEINGFNIIGGTFTNYCIRIDGSSNIMIANNRFKNAYEGVFTFGALSTVIKNNIFETKNGIDGWNGTNNLTILSNIFNNQTSSVKCNIGTTALIKDNIFNEYSSALYIQTSTDAASTVTSINNNFNKSGYAIFCGGIGVTSYNDYFAGPVKYYSSFGYYTPTISNESTKPNVYMKAQDTKVGVMNAPSDTTYGSYNKNLIESRMWGTNYNLKEEANLVLKNFNNMDPNTAAGIFSGLLANKDKFGRDPNMPIDPNQLKLIVNDVLSQNALAIPMDGWR